MQELREVQAEVRGMTSTSSLMWRNHLFANLVFTDVVYLEPELQRPCRPTGRPPWILLCAITTREAAAFTLGVANERRRERRRDGGRRGRAEISPIYLGGEPP